MQAEGGVETAEELSDASDDELTTIASKQIVSGALGDALACDSARSGGVKSAETAAGAGQNRVYGGDGSDAVTAVGGFGKILLGGTGDDKIGASEGDDTFVLDLRRLTADGPSTRSTALTLPPTGSPSSA